MRRVVATLGFMALCAALLPLGTAGAAGEADAETVPGSYIVSLATGDPAEVAQEHANEHRASVQHVYRHALRGYAARMSERAAARIARDDRVAAVVADRRVQALHHCPRPDHPHCAPSEPEPEPEPTPDPVAYRVPTGVQRVFWQDSSATDVDGVVNGVAVAVAIIDTGIASHADLSIAGGYNCSNGPTSAWDDGNGHGTHVAGTAAANGEIVGVAPGAPLYAVRVLDNAGNGTWSSVICGVDWVTARAGTITVANMSLGGSGSAGSCTDGGLRQAICASVAAGVTYVAAAGNSAVDAGGFVPARYPETIAVSALADFDGKAGGLAAPTCRTDVDDTHADFSNYGDVVDLIAPGVCIESTGRDGGYRTMSGTSMAAPHVAGAAALYLDRNPGRSPSEIRSALVTAGNFDYSYTWDGTTAVPGTKPPLLDVSTF